MRASPIHSRLRPRRPGFTLVEMLIVMGIIVLAVTLAVPAIRALTGTKSEQAAQNTVAAYLSSARADAVGIQDIEGVLFYLDPGTGRVACQEVAQSPAQSSDIPGVIYLDLESGAHPDKSRDPLYLPPGIRLMTIKDSFAGDPFSTAQYLGYNTYPPAKSTTGGAQLGGVILFNGSGRIWTGRYGFHFLPNAGDTNPSSALGEPIFGKSTPSGNWPVTSSDWLTGQFAFAFYDREIFLNQGFLDNNQGDGNTNAQQTAQDVWLNQNATPIFVNRYNGTLTRAE